MTVPTYDELVRAILDAGCWNGGSLDAYCQWCGALDIDDHKEDCLYIRLVAMVAIHDTK
jgi:hypothetical protein